MNWVAVLGYILGPGGLLGGAAAVLGGRRKSKGDAASQLNVSTLAWAEDLREDLDKAIGRIEALESKLRARDVLAHKHMPWDWHVYAALKLLGHPVEEPPPLIPADQH